MSQTQAIDDRELDRLIDRMCDQIATVDDLAALGRRLVEDPLACEHYVACLETHARLAWQMMPGRQILPTELILDTQSTANFNFSQPVAPIVIVESPLTLRSPLGTWLLSYAAASLFIAIAILGAWLHKAPDNTGARHMPSYDVADTPLAPPHAPSIVGRVSGLVDCEWSDETTQTHNRSFVHVGRRYALAAGFLEITYESGAKVILQGPCVYRVESQRSGFLEVGKLTAHVGTRGEGRGVGEVASGQWSVASESRASNPQSLIPNPSLAPRGPLAPGYCPSPLFVITTPTAVVTDLGTEFGVEVEKSGATRSHVFKGRVQVRSVKGNVVGDNSRGPTARGRDSAVIELTANQSASVQAASDGTVKVTRNASGRSGAFVRAMPQSASAGIRRAASIGDRPGDLAGLGDSVTYACGIDAAGQVIKGSPTVAGTVHVHLYGDRGMLDLGTLRPGESFPTVDEMAEWIATVAPGVTMRTSLHIPGVGMRDIGTLGGPASRATRINAAKQIVGYSFTATGPTHAFLYSAGKMQDLGTLGGDNSFAHDINAAGRVVGASLIANGAIHAFLYTPGVGMKDLGALGGPEANSWAIGIDDAGRVSGCSEAKDGRRHAFRYTDNAGMTDLGDMGSGDLVILYRDGRMAVKKWPPAIPDAPPRREKNSDPKTPGIREERRTSP